MTKTLDRENVTPFGLWLLDCVPRWRWDETLFGGYRVRGLEWNGDGIFLGQILEAYTHYWPHMKYFPIWRVIWRLPILGRVEFEINRRKGVI